MKLLKRIAISVLIVIGCIMLYAVYAFRFAPELQKLYASDGKVTFGYDRMQKKWLFNEYQQYPLGIDGPHIFSDAGEAVFVRQIGDSFAVVKEKITTARDSFICNIDAKHSFKFKIKGDHTPDTCRYEMPSKLLAISDIEGNFEAFTELLIGNHVVNENLDWSYGDGHLVLVGDFVDRGEDVTQCLWLIYKLEQEAVKSGGKVHYIIGNHEQLNMQGYAAYTRGKYMELVRRLNIPYGALFGTGTELGKWLRTKNTIEQIGDIIFVHGGISPGVAATGISLEEMNNTCRKYIDTRLENTVDSQAGLLLSKNGILWYRGMVTSYHNTPKLTLNEVDDILGRLQSKHIVIGHSIVDEVSKDYDGKVIRIDIKHSEKQPQALYIENNRFYRTDTKGQLQKL